MSQNCSCQRRSLSPVEEDNQMDRSIIDSLRDQDIPGVWSEEDLQTEMKDRVGVADSLYRLESAGMIHRREKLVFLSKTAARTMEVAEAF